MFYINATWYGDSPYLKKFKDKTGMSDAQITTFFDPQNPASFGYIIKEFNSLNAIQWSCTANTNCTAEELANK